MKGPTVTLSLDWRGGLAFRNHRGSPAIRLDSATPGVTSPPQALAYAVMACMAMDIVHVLEKGRHRLEALAVRLEGERAATHPRRFIRLAVHFDLTGRMTEKAVARAIDLSREKYCSVWNTLKDDVELRTAFTIHEA